VKGKQSVNCHTYVVRAALPSRNSPKVGGDAMSAESVFDNLEAIRLAPDAAETAGTREILRHVPVRKPNRTEFVRVHPDAEMQLATGVFVRLLRPFASPGGGGGGGGYQRRERGVTANVADETSEKQRRGPGGRPFRRGESGNPNGRPPGARNKTCALALKLMDAEAEPVIRAVIEAARKGDISAAKLVLERIAPMPRNRPVSLCMPPIETPADLGDAMDAILQAAAAGGLSPDEAVSIASLIETRRRAIETLELEARIAALEQRA
jgi:hypothetical protein